MRGVRTRRDDAIRSERLILAAKAAIAASAAWLLAPYVPYADGEYSYYAPLGVLVSMYPTLAASARAGLQSLAGLAIGIALGLGGLGIVFAGMPAVIGIAVVIGAGIVIGGIRPLGAGRELVAIAGLFVLLLGGPDADEFSLSYLLTMAFGIVVGILTNLLIVPPLYLRRASDRLTVLRDAVTGVLRDAAEALEDRTIDSEDIARSARDLADLLTSASDEVRTAEESSRGNPRSRGRAADRRLNARRMRALERTTRATMELADILVRARDDSRESDAETWAVLSDAVRASADLVEAPAHDERAGDRLETAAAALDRAVAELDRLSPRSAPAYSRAYAYAAAVCVRRMVDASRDFVAGTG